MTVNETIEKVQQTITMYKVGKEVAKNFAIEYTRISDKMAAIVDPLIKEWEDCQLKLVQCEGDAGRCTSAMKKVTKLLNDSITDLEALTKEIEEVQEKVAKMAYGLGENNG